jgi:anti-sigma regulatory factor (Ser/Thr protein kinase)
MRDMVADSSDVGKDAKCGEGSLLELDLQRDESAPRVARAAITGLCERIGLSGARCQTLLLLVSEVVTNAVVHSKAPPSTPIRFKVDSDDERVRVVVHDHGPEINPPSTRQDWGGWGLRLLDSQARDWGIERRDGTLVWFELVLDDSLTTADHAPP